MTLIWISGETIIIIHNNLNNITVLKRKTKKPKEKKIVIIVIIIIIIIIIIIYTIILIIITICIMRLNFTSISSKHLKKARESQRLKELTACGLQNITLFYKRDKQKYNAYEKENTIRNIVLF